jgi:phage terminase large subunit-like protein
VAAVRRRRVDAANPGRWTYPEVGLNVARQNGKGAIIEARAIGQLYLVENENPHPLTIYSAHNFDTSLEHFRRIQFLIEESPKLAADLLSRRGAKKYGVTTGKGNEGIELSGNRRLRFRTRTKGGGRGFSSDCLFLDEAMFISEEVHGALLPIVSARGGQVWYLGSAVDQEIHEHGVVFARVRERGIRGDDPELAYFEWSAGNGSPEEDDPDSVGDLADQAAWAQANPALGVRITPQAVDLERRSMDRRTFAVERLGVGVGPELIT